LKFYRKIGEFIAVQIELALNVGPVHGEFRERHYLIFKCTKFSDNRELVLVSSYSKTAFEADDFKAFGARNFEGISIDDSIPHRPVMIRTFSELV